MKNKKTKKDLVISALLARLTHFQMHSQDDEFFNWCEEVREILAKL